MTVRIIMGSKADWPTMQPAAERLDIFAIDFESIGVSAARPPPLVPVYY
ncbi:AIR carboxylase family protein [Pseudoalteromonas sp. S2755]|nr:AIR carboxylase family protein [Pseudoalteromonas sp. S2755]